MAEGKKNLGGRPRHEPDARSRAQVKAMIGYGITQAAVARSMSISTDTLQRYYREELDTGAIAANAAVAGSLYKRAMGTDAGSVTAAIFWLKCRAGWRDVAAPSFDGGASDEAAKIKQALKEMDDTVPDEKQDK